MSLAAPRIFKVLEPHLVLIALALAATACKPPDPNQLTITMDTRIPPSGSDPSSVIFGIAQGGKRATGAKVRVARNMTHHRHGPRHARRARGRQRE